MITHNNIDWYIGCSGFHYTDWKETFYPKGLAQRKWFDHYCEHFNTLELNVTFYRFPQLKMLQNWYVKSPAGFVFSVKAPRLITHYKQFNETQNLLTDFYTTVREGLQEKAGCILFQLTPQAKYSPALLTRIVEQLDPAFLNVVEFRHASWWRQEVYTLLAKHHISFCGISHPQLPDQAIANTPIAYYRFHGVPTLYYSAYENTFLQQIINSLQPSGGVQKAFLYFNNTAQTAAIQNAQWLLQQLRPAISV